ncbi:MAG: DUF934 domain-containing protein [Rubrivivax sp.]|nr:DUF934 domain-containing protein [Rubrivivax sp.]
MRFIDPAHDPWQRENAEGTPLAAPQPALLSWSQWQAWSGNGPEGLPLGVILPNDADPEELRRDLGRLSLIVLQFPKWTDGRAYSQARLLRTRLRFAGELRAEGEVLVDMLPLLQRTGFDAVLLRSDQQLASAERALRFFAAHYQGDVLETRAVFADSRSTGAAPAAAAGA